jgi:hypothetical protein
LDNLNIPVEEKKQIPQTAKARIKELMGLPLHQKAPFLPASGDRFRWGPFIYEVAVVHAGKLRFTAKLADVIIQGVNDDVSPIIDPNTGKGFSGEDKPVLVG